MLFLLVYYRGAGINAVLALIFNLVILLGMFGLMPALGLPAPTLTLQALRRHPHHRMGVDSNVLIFERIREELRSGKDGGCVGRTRVQACVGDRSSIPTLRPLFRRYPDDLRTGPVRGFAVTLTFGLLANLFTSVFVSRTIFDAILEKKERGAASYRYKAVTGCRLSVVS